MFVTKYQVSSIKYQVSSIKYQVSSIKHFLDRESVEILYLAFSVRHRFQFRISYLVPLN